VEQLARDIRAVMRRPQFADRTANLGIDVRGDTPAELEAWMRGEMEKWERIARDAHLKAQ